MKQTTLTLSISRDGRPIVRRCFDRPVIKIGQLPTSSLVLADASVAKMHAVLELTDGGVRAIDLGSATGTLINGSPVERSGALRDGDILQIGPFTLRASVNLATSASRFQGPNGALAPEVSAVNQAEAVSAAMRPVPSPDVAGAQENVDEPRVREIVTRYHDTIVDVRHLGRGSAKPNSLARIGIVVGGLCVVGGLGMAAVDIAQDWPGHRKATAEAQATGKASPQAPGFGIAGLGSLLTLLGLVPLVGGVTAHRSPGRRFTVGQSPAATFNASIPELSGGRSLALVDEDALGFTATMEGEVCLPGAAYSLSELVATGGASHHDGWYRVPLPVGAVAQVRRGALTFDVRSVAPSGVTAARSSVDRPFWIYNAGSAAVIGSLIVLTQLIPADAMGLSLDEGGNVGRFVGYLSQPPQPVPDEPEPEQAAGPAADAASSERAARASGSQGAMGDPKQTDSRGRFKLRGINHDTRVLARDFNPDTSARREGILGLIASSSGSFLSSPEAALFADGAEDENLWGQLRGVDFGAAVGTGGLGLTGPGRGGGGLASGIVGLGGVGLIGQCSGPNCGPGRGTEGRGYEPTKSTAFDQRRPKTPRVRIARPKLSGGLDRDIIRRVVRSHINEIRGCYNQGLVRDPNLRGRVSITFRINANGTVARAAPTGDTLRDPGVGRCVARAVSRWRFPAPRHGGGGAIVTYPFVFESA